MYRNFYQNILPRQGVYCVTTISRAGKARNLFAEDLDTLFATIEEANKGEVNVFVAPNTFDGYSRKSEKALFARSFFIDLDVGHGLNKYTTKQEASEALDSFLTDNDLPPPVRVDSGRGLHAYWVFDEDIPVSEWRVYAAKFKNFCKDKGLMIDPAVTADAARIMRAPGTLNYKEIPPLPVTTFDQDLIHYDFSAFKDFLGVEKVEILPKVERGLDEDTIKMLKLDQLESVFGVIAQKSIEDYGCNQIKKVLVESATCPEPMWHSALSIARHCSDWETAIHLMSEDHPDYNAEETIRKANETFGKPQSCSVFEERNPGGCDGCPYRGRITNPLAIGRQVKQYSVSSTDETEAETQKESVRTQASPKKIPPLPDYLIPFFRSEDGSIWYQPAPVVDKKGVKHQEDPHMILRHNFYPIKRMYDENHEGDCLIMRVELPQDPTREFALPMSCIYSLEKMRDAISKKGVFPDAKRMNDVMNYLIRWGQYYAANEAAEQMRKQMGWIRDRKAFVLGEKEIRQDGSIVSTAASQGIRTLATNIHQYGDYDKWKRLMGIFNRPGFEIHAFGMLCGIGSPLMVYTSVPGATVSFRSVESGSGKTSALYGAMSFWGKPNGLALSGTKQGSTTNGLTGWYLGLKNLPFGLDEAHGREPHELASLIHNVAQGKAKIRMQSSVNSIREVEENSQLILLLTTNDSVYEKVGVDKTNPEGERARLMEFTIEKPSWFTQNIGIEHFGGDGIQGNFGFAGVDYIQYLFHLGEDEVKQRITKWGDRFQRDFGDKAEYRFYLAVVSTSFAAGEMAVEAGIIDLDIERIYEKLVSTMCAMRDGGNFKLNVVDYNELLGRFIEINLNSLLIMDGDRVTREPKWNKLVARIEIDEERLFVSKKEMKKFLSEQGISPSDFEQKMANNKVLLDKNCKKRMLAGYIPEAPSVSVYVFKHKYVEQKETPTSV